MTLGDDRDGQLALLGLNDRWKALFAPHAEEDVVPARVVRSDRGFVLAATADATVRAENSAKLRRESSSTVDLPAAGDWVALRLPPGHDSAVVEAVLHRTSAFVRSDPAKSGVGQVLAANIDHVFVVHPIVEEPNLRRIERELAVAWDSGAVPVVVLTKADLSADPVAAIESVRAVAPGVDVLAASGVTGEGVEDLLAYAAGHATVALIGPSGAGKSTLVNAMLGEERQATRDVRVSDGRGRHTTVARELFTLPGGGVLVDTPGLRAVAMTEAEEGISAVFPDIEGLAGRCRFRDCAHEGEPGCAVLAAVESGELPEERLNSYRKLLAEARAAAVRADARLQQEERRKWTTMHKSLKDHPKYKGKK